MTEHKGYLPIRRTKWVTLDGYPAADGYDPPMAEIVTSLTFGQLDAIPGSDASYNDVWPAIAPYVVAWNLMGEDATTGEIVAVPPPGEAGADVFAAVEPAITAWLWLEIKTAHRGGVALPKGRSSFGDTPETCERRRARLATAVSMSKPDGYDLATWFDLSPLRPDEWVNTSADLWTEALTLRTAIMKGVEDGRAEVAMHGRLKEA